MSFNAYAYQPSSMMLRNEDNEAITWSVNTDRKMIVRPFVETAAKFTVEMPVSLQGFNALVPVESREFGVPLDNHNLDYQGKDENDQTITVQGHVSQELYTINKHIKKLDDDSNALLISHTEAVNAQKLAHSQEKEAKADQIEQGRQNNEAYFNQKDSDTESQTTQRTSDMNTWKNDFDAALSAHATEALGERNDFQNDLDAQNLEATDEEDSLQQAIDNENDSTKQAYGGTLENGTVVPGTINTLKTDLEGRFDTKDQEVDDEIQRLESEEVAMTTSLSNLVSSKRTYLIHDLNFMDSDLAKNVQDAKDRESYIVAQVVVCGNDQVAKRGEIDTQIGNMQTDTDTAIGVSQALTNALIQVSPDNPVGEFDKFVEITNSMTSNEQRILDQLELANKEINKAAKALSDKFGNVYVDENPKNRSTLSIDANAEISFNGDEIVVLNHNYGSESAALIDFPKHCVITLSSDGSSAEVTSVNYVDQTRMVFGVRPIQKFDVNGDYIASQFDAPFNSSIVNFDVSHYIVRYPADDTRAAANHDIVGTMDEKLPGDAWLDAVTGLPLAGIVPARYEVNDANGEYKPVFKIGGVAEHLVAIPNGN